MRDTKTNRSVVFKRAYWARVLELFDLMDQPGRAEPLEAVRSNHLGRKTLKRLSETATATNPGPLTLHEAHKVAKRYGLWETRRTFDWGSYPPMVRPETRRLDEALWTGIYDLDVTLRREVEALLRPASQDLSSDATALRPTVEAAAGRLAAALDVADAAEQHHPDWADLRDDFNAICNDLDQMLALAGAPRSDP